MCVRVYTWGGWQDSCRTAGAATAACYPQPFVLTPHPIAHPCRDAKLSVLAWDPARHELAPSSLHYFEGDASLKAGRTLFPYPPLAATGGWGGKWGLDHTCALMPMRFRRTAPSLAPTHSLCLPAAPPTHADPQGRCGAVVFFRHQLAVLPAVDSELLALGISGTEEELLGMPGAEAAAAASAAAGGQAQQAGASGVGAGAAQGGTAGAAAGGAAAAGPMAAGAAAVGNSYVDNLGKAGIKEVGGVVGPGWLGQCGRTGGSAAASAAPAAWGLVAIFSPKPCCLLTTPALLPLVAASCRCAMPCSCTATASRC